MSYDILKILCWSQWLLSLYWAMRELIPGWKQSYLEQEVGLNVLQSSLPRNISTTEIFCSLKTAESCAWLSHTACASFLGCEEEIKHRLPTQKACGEEENVYPVIWKCKLGVTGLCCVITFAFGGVLCEENNSSLSCSVQGPVINMIELFICLCKRWFATREAAGVLLSSCPKSSPQMTWNKVEGILLCGLKCKPLVENKSNFKAKSATHPLWILECSFRPPGGSRLWNARCVSIKLVVWFVHKGYSRLLGAKRIQMFLFPWDLH